jgi:tight adherence protein B
VNTIALNFAIFGFIALAVAGVSLLTRELVLRRRERIDRRLEGHLEGGVLPTLRVEPAPLGRWSVAARIDRWFGRLVTETGIGLSAESAFLSALTAGLLLGGALFLYRDSLISGLGGLLVGVTAVMSVFFVLRARRHGVISEQFPETVELLARGIRAGESVDQAIEMVSEHVPDPLATEFRRCASQLQMGLSLEASIAALSRRVPLSETRLFAAALMIQRQAGGELAVALERMANVFRDRLAYQRQYRAATALARGSAGVVVVVTALAAAFMLIRQPEYVREFLSMAQGQAMLAAAIVLQITGIVWLYSMFRTEY